MRRGPLWKNSRAWMGAALCLLAAPAFGQVPLPNIPNTEERSGLLTRFVPITPHLPPDCRRDTFYDTRFGDPPNLRKFPTYNICNGGLYGLRWGTRRTETIAPFFFGTPGGKVTADCAPRPKLVAHAMELFHPNKPVGMYYDQGCYVPVYNHHPFTPGPGGYPFSWYWRGPGGG